MASPNWSNFFAVKKNSLIPIILTLSTSGFTMLFTTSMQEEGIVADNDPQAEILVLSLFI